jgi:putative methionine-R-sulfoxide reductase with GAF domain
MPISAMAKEAIYRGVLETLRSRVRAGPRPTREESMALAIQSLWRAFGGRPLSWIGFYEIDPAAPHSMILLVREPKPACSPIGLHGMCGRCALAARPMVVRDVATLGEGYIACDPADRSELVVPLIEPDGACRAVLDADSYDVGAFDETDAAGCSAVLEVLGLSEPRAEHREVVSL